MIFAGSSPNYFVGVRTNRKDINNNVSLYIKQIQKSYRSHEDREEFLQAVVQPIKHHVTLCVCTLKNDDEIERVKQVKILRNIYFTIAFSLFGGIDLCC